MVEHAHKRHRECWLVFTGDETGVERVWHFPRLLGILPGAMFSTTVLSDLPINSGVLDLNRFRPRLDIGEGDGTPLQYSCLENPMHGGAW